MCQTLKYISYLMVIGLFSIFSSCSTDALEETPIDELKEGYVKIEFELPDYLNPATPTRAMSEKEERVIDIKRLSILLFDESPSNKFLYHAPIVENSFQYDKTNPRKATVVLKLAKTEEATRLVVVANRVVDASVLKENVTPLNDFLRSMKYQMPKPEGKWNATSGSSEPFPMFGQYKIEKIDEKNKDFSVPMFRALARIDVGVNFEIDPEMKSGPFSDKANGLANFELKDIRVYRTHDSGFVAPLRDDFKDVPSVPTKDRRVNGEPLHFSLAAGDVNALVREIYVPEAQAPKSAVSSNLPNDTIHTLVIGGAFEGGETTYYRLDFAQDDKEKMMRTYYSILRNHRYVFNITAVRSPGFSTPEKALKSTSTTNLDFQLISWDETIHEMHVNGQHYFGLDNRVIDLSPRMDGDFAKDNFKLVKYQTNYPIENLDAKQVFEWTSAKGKADLSVSEHFNVEWNKGAKSFKITPKKNNVTNVLISDTLHVKAGTFDLSIIVNQDYLDFVYTLKCESVMVSGTYKPQLPLDKATHIIELDIVAGNKSMEGMEYHLYTDTVNGISFEATGKFPKDILTVHVKMEGKGALNTSLDKQAEPFSMVIKSNSSSGSRCEATISPVLRKLIIVSAGLDNTFGYNLNNNRPTNWVINQKSNFGPNDDSRVKVEGFRLIDGGNQLDNTAQKWLKGEMGEYPDILHIGYDVYMDEAKSVIINDFLKNGGVMLYFTQLTNAEYLLKKVFNNDKISVSHVVGMVDVCVPLSGNVVNRPKVVENIVDTDEQQKVWVSYLEQLKSDPILNGPFGDVSDKQWGEDAGTGYSVKNMPVDSTTTVYSTNSFWRRTGVFQPGTGEPTVFKHETDVYNLIYVGDGGFTSQSGSAAHILDTTICPFNYDKTTFFPISKPFGHGLEVYNSQLFCNMMAWAIDRATSEKLMERKAKFMKK